jgi:hypothetical protein
MHAAVELGLAVDQLGVVVRARVAAVEPAELAELARELGVLRAKVAEPDFPLVIGSSISGLLDSHQRAVQSAERRLQGGRADRQMAAALEEQEGEPFFVASLALEPAAKFSLAKAAKLVPGAVPALILSVSGAEVKAKAVVPAGLVSQQFSAEQWLAAAAQGLGAEVKPPKGQDGRVHCNMLAVRPGPEAVEGTVLRMLGDGKAFARERLCSSGTIENKL